MFELVSQDRPERTVRLAAGYRGKSNARSESGLSDTSNPGKRYLGVPHESQLDVVVESSHLVFVPGVQLLHLRVVPLSLIGHVPHHACMESRQRAPYRVCFLPYLHAPTNQITPRQCVIQEIVRACVFFCMSSPMRN